MTKLIDEFRHGWQGISQPSPPFSIGFAVCCLVLSTLARWGLALIRPDVFFTPYFPAVFFATAFGGFRIGIATAIAGGGLGVAVNFDNAAADPPGLLLMFWAVWWADDMGRRALPDDRAQQRQVAKRLIEEEEYRKLVVDEPQHRRKQDIDDPCRAAPVLHDQPQVWARIDHRIRALSATDDLIAKVDGRGCDIRDLLRSELGPYGHVRFNLNGDPLFLPAKLAVSLALIFHELATNAGKYGAFSAANGMLQVSWLVSDDNLNIPWLKITWDETEGPTVENVGAPGFGTKLLQSALRSFDGKTEISFLKTGVHCTMQCRIPAS
jgi:two-component sensor histidine kinase